MKLIGIVCKSSPKSLYLPRNYIDSVEYHGGKVVLLPHRIDKEYIKEISSLLSGLLITGGGDIHPRFYGENEKEELKRVDERRDMFEIQLIKEFFKKKKPVLGICRGMQILNVCFGGTLYQEIKRITKLSHWQKTPGIEFFHSIRIDKNTKLYEIFETENLNVNSFHHQAVRDLAKEFIVSAKAEDGVIEAIEHKEHPFMIGVQFHPEYMYRIHPFSKLFKSFVNACLKG